MFVKMEMPSLVYLTNIQNYKAIKKATKDWNTFAKLYYEGPDDVVIKKKDKKSTTTKAEESKNETTNRESNLPTNCIWNSNQGRFEFTEPVEYFHTKDGKEISYEELLKQDAQDAINKEVFVKLGSETHLDYQTVEDIIDSVSNDCSDIEYKITRHMVITVLWICNRINHIDLNEHIDRKNVNDSLAMINSFYKFFTGETVYSNKNCFEINEYLSMKELTKIIESLNKNEDCEWNSSEQFSKIVKKVREGFKNNNKRELEDAGLDDLPIEPLLFNNSDLNTKFDKDGNLVEFEPPVISSKVSKYLEMKFNKILAKTDYKYIGVYPYTSADSAACIDKARAIVEIQKKDESEFPKKIGVDLGTSIGMGYSMIMYTGDANTPYIYISLDRHPEIVRRLIDNQNYFDNTNDTQAQVDLSNVIREMLPYSGEIYRYFDFSNNINEGGKLKLDMTAVMENLTDAQKLQLANNLEKIIHLNWNIGITYLSYRFRFVKFQDENNFTVVSDKFVRNQYNDETHYAAPSYANYYRKYCGFDFYKECDAELRVVIKDGEVVRIVKDKEDVDLNNPNNQQSPVFSTSMVR